MKLELGHYCTRRCFINFKNLFKSQLQFPIKLAWTSWQVRGLVINDVIVIMLSWLSMKYLLWCKVIEAELYTGTWWWQQLSSSCHSAVNSGCWIQGPILQTVYRFILISCENTRSFYMKTILSIAELWWHMQKCDGHTFAYVTMTL